MLETTIGQEDKEIEVEEPGDGEQPAGSNERAEIMNSLVAMLDLPRIPQQARSREKRERIIGAALKLFLERGYEATGIDDIAATAEVSVGTFYGYFRNKQQVFLSYCLETIGESISVARMVRLDFSEARPRQVIREAVARTLGSYVELKVYRIWIEMTIHDPQLAEFERKVFERIIGEVEDSLRYIKAQGRTWPNLDVEVTAAAIVVLLDNLNLRYTIAVEQGRLAAGIADAVYRMVFPPEQGE